MRKKLVCLSLIFTLVVGLGVWPEFGGPVEAADAGSGIVYVNANAKGRENGTSWENAYRDLEDALSETEENSGKEIWVAKGTYYPVEHQEDRDRRTRHFKLKNGVAVRGGFAGNEKVGDGSTVQAVLANRDFKANETVLSADINRDRKANGNVYQVIKNKDVNATAVLDGVTITGGFASDKTINTGAGMLNENSSPTLLNIIFTRNEAVNGGGLANYNSSPKLTNVTFADNRAARSGGGIYNQDNSNPIITNAVFYANRAADGGGLFNASSSPVLTNVTIAGNEASDGGGGILNAGASKPQLRNSIVGNNNDRDFHSITNRDGGTIDISYSIVQDDKPDGILNEAVGNSIAGNSDADPLLFTDQDRYLQPKKESPAIDKGTNAVFQPGASPDLSNITTDRSGRARIVNGTVDIGAYEFVWASKVSLTLTPDLTEPTQKPVQVTVKAELEGENNGVVAIKWAEGQRDAAYFANSGTDITGSSKASFTANGTYTFYVRDKYGNEAVKTIAISNIWTGQPVIQLTPDTTAPTNSQVKVAVNASAQGTGNSLIQLKWASGNRNTDYFASQGTDIRNSNSFSVTSNGVYTVFALDKAGNAAVKTIEISNIGIGSKPLISTALSTQAPVNGSVDVTVIATVQASGAKLSQLKWADGTRDAAYFDNRGSAITNGGKFTATSNGVYTVYARDSYGNETVSTISVTNIIKVAPVIQTSISPQTTTTGSVQVYVSVTLQGEGNGLAQLKWDSGQRDAAYFASKGTDIKNANSFLVYSNGTYTVYAKDTAGNASVALVQVTNIRSNSTEESWCSINRRTTVVAGKAAVLNISDQVSVNIPSGAAGRDLCYQLETASKPDRMDGAGYSVLSGFFKWGADYATTYAQPVQLSIAYDRWQLRSDQVGSIFSYDPVAKRWTELGGTADGNRIKVDVRNVTTGAIYAVFSRDYVPPKQPVTFNDIAGHWAAAGIREAAEKGIVQGDPSGRFRPNASITRAEFVVMVMNSQGPITDSSIPYFRDGADIGSWAQPAIAKAVRLGLVSGYEDGTFRPNARITRAEIAVIIGRMLKIPGGSYSYTSFDDDRSIPKWAKSSVESLHRIGIVDGRSANRFEPLANATRAEAVLLLLRAIKLG
ncbi:S-layer homology domain-containing protein [Paenibacillus sp. NPDC058174]|uniref:S-layer homology domain-containing protein n=1 Tax=Paenibacillus sp. NPDC058174 TaxID=3346366 RepID=UPI0036D85987